MDRKELRIRGDQSEALTSLTRDLNRGRRGRGERITDHTLIRVAIDLPLQRSDQLNGVSESELLEPVTTDVTDLQSSS